MAGVFELGHEMRTIVMAVRKHGLVAIAREIPEYVTSLVAEAVDGFDRKHGTETTQIELAPTLDGESSAGEGTLHYWPTLRVLFLSIMEQLRIALRRESAVCDFRDFTFIDMGCGKGRVLLMASDMAFRKIIGIDFSPRLVRIAQDNISRYGSRGDRFEVLCCDGAAFEFPPNDTVLYFYYPFPDPLMSVVIGNLKRSLKEYPRELIVVFNHPCNAHLLDASGFLRQIGEGKHVLSPLGWRLYRSTIPG
jgi:SAM-dependent methyltransferase